MDNLVIPKSLQITMDDVGWFNGSDDRENGGSARTAMTRRHCHEDYAAINELGKRLNMRINCAFVLGEWDPDNRLGRIKWLSKFGDGWNNAAYLGKEEMAAVADTVRNSEFIDVAVHGLLHNYYKPGIPYSNSDYFYSKDGKLCISPKEEIRARFDAFFDILDYYGIKKTVNSFIPPTFSYIWNSMTDVLSDYGIKYVSTVYEEPFMEAPADFKIPKSAGVENGGIITLNRNNNDIPWYEISTNLDKMPVLHGIFGCHWPNMLHEDKERHGEIIDNWVRYFERCRDSYGIILSRDIAFAATQSLYEEYTKISYSGKKTYLDVSAVPNAKGRSDKFYISAKNPIAAYSGCELREYERRAEFINYEVNPLSDTITLE